MTFTQSVLGKVDNNNSTSTPLGGNATFTGTATDSSKHESAVLTITSDVASSNAGVRIEHSQDGTNWDYFDVFTYDTKVEFIKAVALKCAFVRVVYENGSSAQSVMRLQLCFKANSTSDEKKQNLDAFGRLRTSHPSTLLEVSHLRGKNSPQITELIVGTATSTLGANSPYAQMAVSTLNDRVVRQTRARAVYQPGKSQYILCTGVLNSGTNDNGVESRIGYFDDDDGVFFSYSAGVASVNLRTSTSGSPVTSVISQSNWNIDAMDGNGESGIDLDSTKTLIYFFDLEWLGVGRVRTGIIVQGQMYPCHEFYHSNGNLQEPYIALPSLPIRWEIVSTVSTNAGSMRAICGTVSSEGGHSPVGRQFSAIRSDLTGINTAIVPLLSLRLKAGTSKVNAFVKEFGVVADTSDTVSVLLYVFRDTANPLTGASFVNPSDDSDFEYDITATAVNLTGGTLISSTFSTASSKGDVSALNAVLASNLVDQSDYAVLCARNSSGNASVVARMSWSEFL